MTDHLSILRTQPTAFGRNRHATKTISIANNGTWLKSKQSKTGILFRHKSVPVNNIHGLYEVLQRESRDPTAFVIRGKLKDGVDGAKPVYRRSGEQHGDTAHFEEVPRQWMMIDFDEVPVGDVDLFDVPESAVEEIIDIHLPSMFHDVSCVWQLSSGAGTTDIEGVLSLHIWFWLDRPMVNDELKVFHANHAPSVDRTLFQTVQQHFIAAPVFKPPAIDPLPRRIGIMQREFDVLTLPHVDISAKALRESSGTHTGLTGSVRGLEAKLGLMGDGEGLSGFNGVIPAAVSSYVCKRFPQEIDAEAIKDRVRDAIKVAPCRSSRSQSYLNLVASDGYLDPCIRTATVKFALKNVTPLFPAPTISSSEARAGLSGHIVSAVSHEISRLAA
jgi:hypothetical protein